MPPLPGSWLEYPRWVRDRLLRGREMCFGDGDEGWDDDDPAPGGTRVVSDDSFLRSIGATVREV